MGENNYNQHYVCTLDEARTLVEAHGQFFVSNCGCRERRGGCARSRMDVCLYFNADFSPTGSGKRPITIDDARGILAEAKSKHLIPRPFRNMQDRNVLDGICFCCDDCCSYFAMHEEACDKGAFIEDTKMDECTTCGDCVDVCHFGARKIEADSLVIDKDKCFGCGLCADVCPTGCISMIAR